MIARQRTDETMIRLPNHSVEPNGHAPFSHVIQPGLLFAVYSTGRSKVECILR